MTQTYDCDFFSRNYVTASTSAEAVVPLVYEWIRPTSVVDLGCGTGSWLAEFRKHGAEDIRGIDGDYVDREMLRIPASCFTAHDLQTKYVGDRRFDLAMSLEVAEHLPEEHAPMLVESLTSLAPLVLFSAAIPHQGGVNHVNCQWPAFWAQLFDQHGFVAIDCLRARLWENEDVAWWYRQNILIYGAENVLDDYPVLADMRRCSPSSPPSLIHPVLLQWWIDWGMSQSKLYWDLALGKNDSSQ